MAENAGSVSVAVTLSLAQLQRDAAAANALIKEQMKAAEKPIALRFDNSNLTSLAQEVLKAKAALADPSQQALLAKEAALLQEAVRFKQQLAAIEKAFVKPEDVEAAKQLAATLNDLNNQKIERDFTPAPIEVPIVPKADEAEFDKLALDILKVKAGLAAPEDQAALQREAALLQESIRYKAQLASIEDAFVDADDLQRAKQLAATLNDLATQKINQDFAVPSGLAGQAQAFQEAVSQASLYTQALSQVGSQLTQTGQSINQFTQQALTAATAFDDARAKVSTLSSDADGLAASMRSLSKELNFQVGSTELLNASYDVLSSGFTDTAEVTGILEAATLGAIGGFSDIGTVADATTVVLNSFKLSADQASHVVNILSATQDAGRITIDEYAGSIGQAASIVATAGVSFEEFSAAIATATAKGVPASSSISGTRQAIVNLLKPTEDAKRVLEQFGISNASATLRSEGLIGVLQRLKDEGAGGDELTRIFSDVDAFATVSTLAGDSLGDFIANLDKMNNSAGRAQASADAVANSFSGQLNLAINQAGEALIDLGKGISDAVVPLLKGLTFIIENFNKLPAPVKEAVGVVIGLTGASLTLAGAIASVAAILPVVNAGLKQMGISGVSAAAGANATAVGATTASGALKGLATATGGLLLKLGLFVAAAKSVELALSRFKDGGEGFNTAAENIEKRLLDLQIQAGATRDAIESTLPKEPPPTDFVDGIVNQFNEINRASNRLVGLPEDFLTLPENSEKLVNDARLGVSNLQDAVGTLTEKARGIADGFKEGLEPTAEQLAEAEATQQNFADSIAEAQAQLNSLDPARLGTDAYAELKTNAESAIAELERGKATFEAATGLQAENADATEATTAAIEEQTSATERLAQAQARQQQVSETSLANRQLEIAQQVADGLLTESEARAENLKAEQQFLNDKLRLNQENIEQLIQARNDANGTEELAAANQAIFDAEQSAGQVRLEIAKNLADQRVAIEQEATEKIQRAIEDIDINAQQQVTGVRQQQASGGISRDDAEQQIAAIQASAIAQQIALLQQRAQVVERGSEEERKLVSEIAGLQEQAANAEIARQEEVARRQLEAIERANREAEAAVEASQTARATAIRQSQLEGVTTAADADRQIAAIEREGATRAIELKRDELEQIQALREEGLLSVEEAGQRELELNQQIGDLNLQRLEAEIEARARLREEQIDQKFAPIQQGLQAQDSGLSNQSAALQGELDLLNAQVGLQTALGNLEQERLNTRIRAAEAAGNEVLAERLRTQQTALTNRQMEAQFASQVEQLNLQQEIRGIELERELINARIARGQSQVALLQAQARGASQEELTELQAIVTEQESQIGLAEQAIVRQETINQRLREQLTAEQALTRERNKQAQIEASSATSASSSSGAASGIASPARGSSAVTGTASGEPVGGRSDGSFIRYLGSDLLRDRRDADRAFSSALKAPGNQQLNLLQAGAGPLNLASNREFLSKLEQSGQGRIGELAQMIQSGEIGRISAFAAGNRAVMSGRDPIAEVAGLRGDIQQLANTAAQPRSVTVQTPDAIANTGRILNDLSRQNMRRLGR